MYLPCVSYYIGIFFLLFLLLPFNIVKYKHHQSYDLPLEDCVSYKHCQIYQINLEAFNLLQMVVQEWIFCENGSSNKYFIPSLYKGYTSIRTRGTSLSTICLCIYTQVTP